MSCKPDSCKSEFCGKSAKKEAKNEAAPKECPCAPKAETPKTKKGHGCGC